MLTSGVVYSVCAVMVAAEPLPDIQECRDSLRASLSRIQTLEMEYEETWQASSNPVPLLEKYRDWVRQEQRNRIAAAKTDEERRTLEIGLSRGEPETTHLVRLVDAFPDVRFDVRAINVYRDGSRTEMVTEQCLSHGQVVHVDVTNGVTHIQTSPDASNLQIAPVAALGRRLAGTVNVSLDMLLDDASAVRVLGREELDGIEVVALQVGPPVPKALRPYDEDDDFFVRFQLAPEIGWLPVRTEWFNRDDTGKEMVTTDDGVERRYSVRRYELADFQPVIDEARDAAIPFPRTIRNVDAAGTFSMHVSRVRINPIVPAAEFDPKIPDGHLVSRDGAVPVVELTGGAESLRRAVSGHADQARKVLQHSGRRGSLGVILWLNIALLCMIGLAWSVLRWRKRNDPK